MKNVVLFSDEICLAVHFLFLILYFSSGNKQALSIACGQTSSIAVVDNGDVSKKLTIYKGWEEYSETRAFGR